MLAGTESTDGYTGTTPVQVAELLGWPSVSFAKHVEISDGLLRVQRQTEAGYEEVTCPLPAVVTVTSGVVEPAVPLVQGDRGREVETRRGARRWQISGWTRHKSALPAPASR